MRASPIKTPLNVILHADTKQQSITNCYLPHQTKQRKFHLPQALQLRQRHISRLQQLSSTWRMVLSPLALLPEALPIQRWYLTQTTGPATLAHSHCHTTLVMSLTRLLR